MAVHGGGHPARSGGDGSGGPLELRSATGRWVVAATVMGSSLAMLTGTVVNVALPAIGRDLDAGVSSLQWILNGYMLAVASLILIGGSFGDLFGHRRVYLVGVAWFAVASVLCALAPSSTWLIVTRALQGVGGALLTPGSLAIIQASFRREDRSAAIGAWSGLTGIAAAVGPPLGGALVDGPGWRGIFVLPVPLAAAVVWSTLRHVPDSAHVAGGRRRAASTVDVAGALLAVTALGGITFPIIEIPDRGPTALAIASGVVGLFALVAFVQRERTTPHPMLPPDIFSSRLFTAANLVTLVVYAALGGVFFLLVVHLQTVAGYRASLAGLAPLPIMALMLIGSPAAGRLAERIGPRLPLTVGPVLLAVGMLMMTGIGPDAAYTTSVLPAVLVFGVGLTLTVTPVTATALAAVEDSRTGAASGVNNAVARTAQLLAVAALPPLAGLTGADFQDPTAFGGGFQVAMMVCAGLAITGSLLAWFLIPSDVLVDDDPGAIDHHPHCAIESAPAAVSSRGRG